MDSHDVDGATLEEVFGNEGGVRKRGEAHYMSGVQEPVPQQQRSYYKILQSPCRLCRQLGSSNSCGDSPWEKYRRRDGDLKGLRRQFQKPAV